MPYSETHKQSTREKILRSAAQRFSYYGYENVSIDEIMQDAGLTRGGFYAHFKTKAQLYAESVLFAAQHSQIVQAKPEAMSQQEWLNQLTRAYLSREHLEHRDFPCPLAFLASDVVHRDQTVRETYTQVFRGLNRRLRQLLPQKSTAMSREESALALSALLIGSVAVSRALDDEELQQKLLDSSHKLAQHLTRE